MARRGENIYKRKDGRWEGRYKKGRKLDGSIHYGYLYGYFYQEVKEKLLQVKATLMGQKDTTSPLYTGTLAEWGTYWLQEGGEGSIKKSTYSSYESKWRVHILPAFGETPLQELTTPTLQQWVYQLEKKLAPRSVHTIVQVFRTCLNAAVTRGCLKENPCQRLILPEVNKRILSALEPQEHRTLKRVAEKDKHGLPILLSLETGLRLGEICGLKWGDIDFDKKELQVARTLQRLTLRKGHTAVVEDVPKTLHSFRRLPLSPALCDQLKRRQKQAKGEYVISENTKPVEPRLVQYYFKKVSQQANLTGVTFHTLRHSFATRCLELGVTIATISALLGHSSTRMTLDVYTHSSRFEERAAIAQLAAL